VKRTLRLVEAIDRAGGHPHILTTDPGLPGSADVLRSRGWAVDVVEEIPQRLPARVRQHLERRPSPILPAVKARLAELAGQAAFVQFESPQSAYYWEEVDDTRVILSTQNVDSQMLASVARGMPRTSLQRLRFTNRSLAMRSVERRAVPRADAVLCVSDHDQRYFERYSDQVIRVPNGVDNEFFGIDATLPDSEDVVFIGQFDYPPNQVGVLRFLREGWPLLGASRPRARLLLAGKGMSDELAREAAATERVDALGLVRDATEVLERSRLVVVPLWQGGGTHLKVLEGLAAARPVVGTPLSMEGLGVEHGLHCMVGADPPELAYLTAELLADRDRSEQLARAGRELAGASRWERTTEPAEHLYREWLRSPRSARGRLSGRRGRVRV
jgi:polysaccharide biosynthesis protein PslH